MGIYDVPAVPELLRGNAYPGRGIILGKTADGTRAAAAYFIMGRSANSRNRVFEERDGAVFTRPFDASRVRDPSLIIYTAMRPLDGRLIVTNGDQTDTVCDGIKAGRGFSESLRTRRFEPDAPNFTPRISGMITFADGDFAYEMSILKSADAKGSACCRQTFSYPALPGLGHLLHTYLCDGSPVPSFQGEPRRVAVPDDIDRFTGEIWDSLNEDNKISLYVRYVQPGTGKTENRLINKNG